MSRVSRAAVVALTVCVAGIGFLPVPVASAATTWHLVSCANTDFSGAKICLYYATGHQAQGRFVNGSSHDIKNQGIFDHVSGSGSSLLCGLVTTKAHTTATCTRSVPLNSTYYLVDNYIGPRLDQETVHTSSHKFTS